MDKGIHEQSRLLVNNIERGLQKNIIRLDQKLKGLRTEIEVKLQNSFLYEDDKSRDEYVEKLTRASQEVTVAIKGIETLVKLVVSDEHSAEQMAFLQGEEVQQFSAMIMDSLEKITEIKTNF